MKLAPLFTIVEQVRHLNGEVPFVEEPRGGRIYKLDLPKANGITVQAKLAEKAASAFFGRVLVLAVRTDPRWIVHQ